MFTTGPFAAQSQLILDNEAALVPHNTNLSYEPKAQEFLEFCTLIYGPGSPFHSPFIPAETVTEEKVFAFLFYQVLLYHESRLIVQREKGEGREKLSMKMAMMLTMMTQDLIKKNLIE